MSANGKSVMVHVEGTRSLSCRTPVMKMTSAFVDMALATRSPIVPVRFVGALPSDELEQRIEFPVGMGQQDIYLGAPIHPETFEALPYKERKQLVIGGINALGPANAEERPFAGDPAFDSRVRARQAQSGATHEHATLFEVLSERDDPSAMIQPLLSGEALTGGDTPLEGWLAELARRLHGVER
jgi:hypothetical protein